MDRDKYILENVLSLTKSLAKLYNDGFIESSNKKVTNLMCDGLNETLESQQTLYTAMSSAGLYKVKNIKASEISKTLTKLTSK